MRERKEYDIESQDMPSMTRVPLSRTLETSSSDEEQNAEQTLFMEPYQPVPNKHSKRLKTRSSRMHRHPQFLTILASDESEDADDEHSSVKTPKSRSRSRNGPQETNSLPSYSFRIQAHSHQQDDLPLSAPHYSSYTFESNLKRSNNKNSMKQNRFMGRIPRVSSLSSTHTLANIPLNAVQSNLLSRMSKILLFIWIFLTFLTMVIYQLTTEPTSSHSHITEKFYSRSNSKQNILKKAVAETVTDKFSSIPIISSSNQYSSHIPIPPPKEKVSVVLINYSRPRMIQESSLMRTLLSHPNVDEVVVLHSNPQTAFKFVHPKVVNIDATKENDEIGLSLRFYFCQLVKNNWVLFLDDDIEFPHQTLSELLIEFSKNTHRIVGRFGRNFNPNSSFNGYSSTPTHKESEVILAKLMVMERNMCGEFFNHAHLVWEDQVLNLGEGPLWYGDDIVMSLIINQIYGGSQINYAMDWLDVWSAPDELRDYTNLKVDVMGKRKGFRPWDWIWWQSIFRRNRKYSYMGRLWKVAKERLNDFYASHDV